MAELESASVNDIDYMQSSSVEGYSTVAIVFHAAAVRPAIRPSVTSRPSRRPRCLHPVAGGESVVLAAKDETRAEALEDELGPLARATSVEDVVAGADTLVFALWLDTMIEADKLPLRIPIGEAARRVLAARKAAPDDARFRLAPVTMVRPVGSKIATRGDKAWPTAYRPY